MQSPTLDERERGGQIREGYGRLQEPGTAPDVLETASLAALLRIPRPSRFEGAG